MPLTWLMEVARVVLSGAVGLALGGAVGAPSGGLAAGLALPLVWHLYSLYRLQKLLRGGLDVEFQGGRMGAWSDVFGRVQRLRQRMRKRKRKLEKYVSRFQASMEAMPDASVILGPGGYIQWFNSEAESLLRLHAPDHLGRSIGELVDAPAFLSFLVEETTDESVEFDWPPGDARHLSARQARFAKNQRLVVVRDLSRLHCLENMRRDFVANVSHELRTPLTVFTGYLETLLERSPQYPEEVGVSLRSMGQQAHRMQSLLEELLLLARLESEDRGLETQEPAPVPAILAAVEEDARQVCGDRLNFDAGIDRELWLYGDAEQLRSAFSNMVQNAVRYTQDAGTVRLAWYRDREGAHFQVSDTGIGIPAKHLGRLTERFYRVDVGRSRSTGGTGLGLAIVKHVLNHHDARLTIESVPGRGSSFTCHFPLERIIERPGDASQFQRAEPPVPEGRTVAVVH